MSNSPYTIAGKKNTDIVQRVSIIKVGHKDLTWYPTFLIIAAHQFNLHKK